MTAMPGRQDPSNIRTARNRKRRKNHTKQTTPVTILYCNPNGVASKTESLASAAEACETEVICLTETKKSIIDYILVSHRMYERVTSATTDEEGVLRIKGKGETDHNTMLVECSLEINNSREKKEYRWKLSNKEGRPKFNQHLYTTLTKDNYHSYNQYEEAIKVGLNRHIGKVKINKNKPPGKPSEETKKEREKMKRLRRELRTAIKQKNPGMGDTLAKYRESQVNLRKLVENDNKKRIEKKLHQIAKSGKGKTDLLWKISKKMKLTKAREKERILDYQNRPILDPETAKEHVAQYCENLYQAREGEPGTEETDAVVKRTVEKWAHEQHEGSMIQLKEIIQMKRTLKRCKANGPDDIPNEVLIMSDRKTLEVHQKMFNKIYNTEQIPPQWQEGRIIRLYKGKGAKGNCSNERGITLASNIGKAFERVINNRNLLKTVMTDNQAGGRKGRATADHIMALCTTINIAKAKHRSATITFLDVTKAYDKAWIDGIMYVMGNNGVLGKEWSITRKLNENLTARIQTDQGLTRQINIKDSIRQGGVLSVNQYALLMDEISKEIRKKNLGITVTENETKLGCLLWMDDVVLIAKDEKDMQEMLEITNTIARKYHLKFGAEKSKYMALGRRKPDGPLKMGQMLIEPTENYKYLGITLNRAGNLKDHIRSVKSKMEGAYQTTISICENNNLRGIQLDSVWKLVQSCIEPIITYGLEALTYTKTDMKSLNSIWTNTIKRILMIPQSTPNEAIHIETGLLDLQTMVERNMILMYARLKDTQNDLISQVIQDETAGGWHEKVKNTMTKYNITEEDVSLTKNARRNVIMKKITTEFKTRITESSETKSKAKQLLEHSEQWQPGKRRKYLNHLTRKQASTILKARARMTQVKNNYKNSHRDLICRMCKASPETQDHVLNECQALHTDDTTKVPKESIFSEDLNTLKNTANKINRTIEILQEV
jgi:hypothetical protein